MNSANIIGHIAAIWALAVITPGPNLLVTVKMCTQVGQSRAVIAVLGIVCATALWGVVGFFGIAAFIAASPETYFAIKLIGGAYLLYLGARMLWTGFVTQASTTGETGVSFFEASPWQVGFLTNLSNPKTALFVASLFAATMPPSPPVWLGLTAALVMAGVSLVWYMSVACMVGLWSKSRWASNLRKTFTGMAGGIFVLLGINLLLTE